MPRKRTLIVVAAVAASFIALAVTLVVLFAMKAISATIAILMLVTLLGLYVGFGTLIAVYRLLDKLD